MNKNQFRIGILGAIIVAILVFSPSAQNVSATHLTSTLGSGSTGITISADGVLSDIDDNVIIIDDQLQIGDNSIVIDGELTTDPTTITSSVNMNIDTTTGNLDLTSVAVGSDITLDADNTGDAIEELTVRTGEVAIVGTLSVTGTFAVGDITIADDDPTLTFTDETGVDTSTVLAYDNTDDDFSVTIDGAAVLTIKESGLLELIAGDTAEIGTPVGDGNTLEIFTESLDAGGTTAGSLTIVSIGEGVSDSGDIFILSDDTGEGTAGGILLETGDIAEFPAVGAGVIELTADWIEGNRGSFYKRHLLCRWSSFGFCKF